jgi:hypothetical protein
VLGQRTQVYPDEQAGEQPLALGSCKHCSVSPQSPPKTFFISARLSLLNFDIKIKFIINYFCRNHASAILAVCIVKVHTPFTFARSFFIAVSSLNLFLYIILKSAFLLTRIQLCGSKDAQLVLTTGTH